MEKLINLLLLFILLVFIMTACTNPGQPIDETSATTGTSADVSTTTPLESESDVADIKQPEDLLTEFPQMEFGNGWLEQTISKYQNPALNEIEPLEGSLYFRFPRAFSGKLFPNEIPELSVTMQDINYPYRVQHITLTDETHICVIYKISRNNQEKYMYRIFEKEISPEGNYVFWNITFENYYLTKTLKHSDFSDFKVGDTLEMLNVIEPACWIDDVWSYGMEDDEGALYISFPLLLEDGALHLTFRCENYKDVAKQENIKSLFLATDIQFYPNGTDAEINGQPLSILKAENRPPLPGEDD